MEKSRPFSFSQTLDQQRAAFAWECVQPLQGNTLKEYLSLIRGFPAMIQTNGLGQALAFLLIQKGAKRKLYDHLQEWLCSPGGSLPRGVYSVPAEDEKRAKRLIEQLMAKDSMTMGYAISEALALSQWLKRMAEARKVEAEWSVREGVTEETADATE